MSEYVTAKQLAGLLGVTEGAVRKAFRSGRIPRNQDKSYDVAACIAAWGRRTDPGRTRVRVPIPETQPRTLADIALATASAMHPRSEFDMGFAAGLIAAAYRCGSMGALIAAESGVSIKHAKALKGPLEIGHMLTTERLLRMLPSWRDIPEDEDIEGLVYEIEQFADVDWSVVAQSDLPS
jgi:hypothetical protein